MKRYELVKYRYGVGPKYTAFCLTPSLSKPKVVERFGKVLVLTNLGSKSRYSRHFQTKEAAMAWCKSNDVEIISPCWSVLTGTTILKGAGAT